MAVISKGITLSYKVDNGEYVELTNLMEIPELGGEVEAIEVTTLGDDAHMYTDGLINYGDSLAFKFLYEDKQFEDIADLIGIEVNWQVKLPDGAQCVFSGKCHRKLDSVGVNAALTYTVAIKPTSKMAWATSTN